MAVEAPLIHIDQHIAFDLTKYDVGGGLIGLAVFLGLAAAISGLGDKEERAWALGAAGCMSAAGAFVVLMSH